MSNNKQTPVWLSGVIAFLLLVIAVLLVWLLINKIGTLKFFPTLPPENWFSYIITLIGVLITLFVGYQIFNMVEIRRDIKDAEDKYEELKNDSEQFKADFRGFQSKLEKEMGAFKLELLNKYNDTERELMKEQGENTQKVDWNLKEIKKDYWDERIKLSDIIEKTNATQSKIRNEMNDINEKWNGIQTAQNDFSEKMTRYRNALINAFVFIRLSNDKNKTLSLYAELLGAALYEHVNDNQLPYYNKRLDSIIKGINEAEKKDMIAMKGRLINVSQSLKKVIFNKSAKEYDVIQQKIYMIIEMIKEKTKTSVE